jgi:hypothetical protein
MIFISTERFEIEVTFLKFFIFGVNFSTCCRLFGGSELYFLIRSGSTAPYRPRPGADLPGFEPPGGPMPPLCGKGP